MSAEYTFDLYPRDDPRDGARLVRYTYEDLIAAEYRAVIGVGSGQATMWADHAGAEFVDVRGEQYARIVRLGGVEAVIGGIWTSKLPFETAVASERRHLTISGPDQMAYLARARMAPHTYIHDIFTGQDPFDSMWRLFAQGLGNSLGAILWRVLYEAQHFRNTATYTHTHADGVNYTDSHADDRLASKIPDLVLGFDYQEDSNGNPWTLTSGDFTAQVGENVLGVVQRLMQSGLSLWMDPDDFTLYAWEGRPATKLGRDTDRTGAAWGADIVRFQYPTDGTTATGNILSETTRVVNAYLPQGPIWVGGNDIYHKETGPADALYEGFVPSSVDDLTALGVIGAAQSTAREEAADVGQVKFRLGDDPPNGAYLPGEHLRLDELVRINTGAGELDYDEDDYPVGAWRISLPKGGAEWEAFADLGASYEEAQRREFAIPATPGHSHPQNPRICRDTAGSPLSYPIELLAKFRFDRLLSAAEASVQVGMRQDSGAGASGAYSWFVSAHVGDLSDVVGEPNFESLYLDIFAESGAGVFWAGVAKVLVVTSIADDEFWLRVYCEGDEIRARAWRDGDAEPGVWQITATGAAIPITENRYLEIGMNPGDGDGAELNSLAFVTGYATTADNFTRTVTDGLGSSPITGQLWVVSAGDATDVSVDGSKAIATDPVNAILATPALSTCIHGGPLANSGDASVACGKCVAAGNHEHDYVAAGGTAGQVLSKASATDFDTEWVADGSAAHIADASDAHDASAVSFDDTGLSITAANAQEMGEALDAAISAGGIPATIFDAAGDIIVASAADTAARLAAGSEDDVLTIVSGVPAWAAPTGGTAREISRTQSIIADECFFHGSGANSYVGGFGQSASGTGAALSVGTGQANHPGVIQLSTGTQAAGRVAFFQISSTLVSIVLGGGAVSFLTIFKIDALSDGTNTYVCRSGLGDSVTGEYTDGVFFRYTHSVNGGRWEIVARANNVETAADSGVAADTNYHSFECEINAAGTSAEFFIDGVSVGTVASNIPTGAGREVVAHGLAVVKSAGTTARTFQFDAYRYTFDFTTPR